VATIVELQDPVPGNIGLIADDDTVVLVPFTEPDDLHPSDTAGTLEDFTRFTGSSEADDSVAWASAVSQLFHGTFGIRSTDKADESSLLTRDVSIQMILAVDHTNGFGTADAWLVLRGEDPLTSAGATEYCAYGLKMQIDPGAALAGEVRLAWTWQDLSGVTFLDTYEAFTAPHGQLFLLTCTRRWVSTTSVVLRYYIGDKLLAEREVADGEIGGATTGSFRIGAGWFGWIDDLKIVDREMSHDEIRTTWARLVKHQPDGVVGLLGQAPPGAVWAKSDGSDAGRLFKAAGQAIGYAASKAHELRETFLPDAAYKDTIGRWEKLVGLQRREQLALDTRRARVVTRLQVENGYSVPKVKAVLATPFDVDAADVNIIEFSPTIEDDFTTLETERWHVEGAGWSIASGELELDLAAGADLRWDAMPPAPDHVRMVLDNGDSPVGVIARVKLSTYWAALPANAIVGLFLYNFRTNDALWFGVKNVGGVRQLGYVTAIAGVLGSFTAIVNPSTDAAYYLTARKTELGYILKYSTISFMVGPEVPLIGGPPEPEYAGVGAMCTDATTAAQLTATFDDFLARMPNGKRAFHWYAYRDPGDPGSPDMEDAERIVQRIKPAHTEAAAVLSLSLLCDNDTGLCDHTPLGGL
jgi:hypothetical protein